MRSFCPSLLTIYRADHRAGLHLKTSRNGVSTQLWKLPLCFTISSPRKRCKVYASVQGYMAVQASGHGFTGFPLFFKRHLQGGWFLQSRKREEFPRSEEPKAQVLLSFIPILAGGWSLSAMSPRPNVDVLISTTSCCATVI